MNFNDSSTVDNNLLMIPSFIKVCIFPVATIIGLVYLWVIFPLFFSRRLRSESNFFLVSLFVNEFLCIVFMTIFTSLSTDIHVHYCKTTLLLFASSKIMTFSGYFVNSAVVTADRYFKISNPMYYIRTMTNKVCARIIVSVWGSLVVIDIGLFIINFNLEGGYTLSLYELHNSQSITSRLIVMMDIVSVPSLFAIVVHVIALVHIARNQRRKIESERVTVGHLATNTASYNNNQAEVQPRKKVTLKSLKYACVYFITIVASWVPIFTIINLHVFRIIVLTQTIWTLLFILIGISMLQMVFGALFLTYIHKEHRSVLHDACKAILNAVRCR